MKKILNHFSIALTASVLLWACQKSGLNDHHPVESDGVPPGIVSNVKVVNGPGAAIITYNLPADKDLQYVMAEYAVNDKVNRVTKASSYTDTIQVDGFNDAGDYTIKLYAVDKGENRSEPVSVTVHPTTPPFRTIAASLNLFNDFAGVNAQFNNPTQDKVALVILARDHNNEWVPAETFYTAATNGSFSVRGYDTIPVVFGAYIRDRWNNYSDTIFKTIHPLYETKLDKTKFRQYRLPSDQPAAWGWEMHYMWDNYLGEPGFHTEQGAQPQPHRFTFDMGVVAKLSRFKILQRTGSWLYAHGNPRYWTMWGSAAAPNSDGSWNGWTKLMDCESIKPSGQGAGVVTSEDVAHALGSDGLGEEFTIPSSAPAVRYIRMEIKKNWSGTDFFHALEITFWGNPQ
ncbi:DUF5000 domain-containing lipoprotein [Niabella drilacis]|uniref:DUF4959 domain-containing protein n=1 Tax=Niabella drilacis (strain DSM 25811 / CCM 8410 / CCUG 62505 / LMG 26954 / E90) TaxID=1285928 RepID=A0A1G6N741_NIADE|nr:DUF5000 domain-containing lipoprotein [Niabella drilacis]SDC62945.1 protein of unknown function [Niabella drilacis]